jgi:Dolichyl-phosphate-mannose-protein mannosyltransferase
VNLVQGDVRQAAGSAVDRAAGRSLVRWWDGALCGLIVVLATLSARPFVGMGFCDDYSYIRTAMIFARTGRVVYNGGATAMLGWQIPWGALFIRLFGFSFTSPRVSTLVIALVSIWLFFLTLIRFRISPRGAYFGALLLGLSPVFLPLAASFMTDIDGLFVDVLCIYLLKRAFDAETSHASIGWLAAAAATNVVGGTVRQIAWLGALVMVPTAAWVLRRRHGVLVAGIVLWVLSAASIFACMHWWKQQPYALNEPILPRARPALSALLGHGGMQFIKDYLCLALLIFPLLAAWLMRMKPLRKMTIVVTLAAVTAVELFSLRYGMRLHQLPWMRDVMGNLGMSREFSWALGANHLVFNTATQFVLSCIVTAVAVLFLLHLWRSRGEYRRAPDDSSANELFWIGVPFVAIYLVLLVPRSLWNGVLDRYLLAVLPFAILAVLKVYEERISSRLPLVSYIVLAAMAVFTITATHDWFALDRARLEAAKRLEGAGVPRTAMQVGLEFDGWTQIDHSPTIVDPRVLVPAGVYQVKPLPRLAPECILWSWNQTPIIDPKYFVVISPMSCLAPSTFAPIGYTTWLPPFHREVYIEQHP